MDEEFDCIVCDLFKAHLVRRGRLCELFCEGELCRGEEAALGSCCHVAEELPTRWGEVRGPRGTS